MSNIKLKSVSGGSVSLASSDETLDKTIVIDPKMFPTAWVNFDGTSTNGTDCTIRDSFNINRVEHLANGSYRVYFTETLDNANYTISGTAGGNAVDGGTKLWVSTENNTNSNSRTVSSFPVITGYSDTAFSSPLIVNIQVLGGKDYV